MFGIVGEAFVKYESAAVARLIDHTEQVPQQPKLRYCLPFTPFNMLKSKRNQ